MNGRMVVVTGSTQGASSKSALARLTKNAAHPHRFDRIGAALGYSRPGSYEELWVALSSGAARLPKKRRQVAIHLWRHPTAAALGAVTSVAAEAGVQPSTLVRFGGHERDAGGGSHLHHRLQARLLTSYVSLALANLGVRNLALDNVGLTAVEPLRCASVSDAVLAVSFTPYRRRSDAQMADRRPQLRAHAHGRPPARGL
jgi:hypothetical protein